jgi:hypothetical protein
MSGTVDYVKVVDLLVDTIKELNQPDLVPAGAEDANGAAEAAAAEHSAASQRRAYRSNEYHLYHYTVAARVNNKPGRKPMSRPCSNKDAHFPKDCR